MTRSPASRAAFAISSSLFPCFRASSSASFAASAAAGSPQAPA
eukprot:CAMPEP_0181537438 /NCGR_PEP_ID=MMETSP1110-20121109/75349_1 /TAXON_ID=174948 /ORGANISM="Symbiodinium sp., Strain CCMP421" /LENGTH=42 /DNA_ID= /DNA_START= /DNA_END= /DNA_ORIENTATION=